MSVRECEDSSLKRWTSGFRECLARSLPVKEPCVEHMTRRWKVMSAWRFSRVSREKGLPVKYSQNILFGKVSCFVLSSFYPHYIYPYYPRKYTSSVRDCYTHNHLLISLWFSSTPTSPSLYHWEVDSPNTYHTQSKCKVRFWSCWQALEGAIHWQMQSDWIARSEKLEKTRFREASW